jgi:hypothetical protein
VKTTDAIQTLANNTGPQKISNANSTMFVIVFLDLFHLPMVLGNVEPAEAVNSKLESPLEVKTSAVRDYMLTI